MNVSPVWKRRAGLGLFAVVLVGALGWVALRSGPLAPTRVTVIKAAEGRFSPSLFGLGTVEARRSFLIGPTTAGRVRQVAVDVGDEVRAGQLLAEMDPVDLDERETALRASLARAGSATVALQAQRRDAQARRALAQANAQRWVDLGAQAFLSAGAVEAKLQERDSALAAVAGAEANLAAGQQDQRRLEAELAGLKQQRANLKLMAPSAGLVVSRDAEAGSTVVAGQAVLRLIDPASLWIRVRLDQGRSAGLAPGLQARVTLRSASGQTWPGRVARVEALSDSVTEERVAMVTLDTSPPSVSVGELAEVTLALPQTAPALVLPNAALRRQGGQTGVWRVDAGRPTFVPVRTGQTGLDGQVQILDGLRAGDEVVVHSDKDLSGHSRLRIVDALAGSGS